MTNSLDAAFCRIRHHEWSAQPTPGIGILGRLFLTRHPVVVDEIFPALQAGLKSASFERDFLAAFKKPLIDEKLDLQAKVAQRQATGEDPRFFSAKLPLIERQLAFGTLEDYLQFQRECAAGPDGLIELLSSEYEFLNDGADGQSYIAEHYQLYLIGNVLYKRYEEKVTLFERFERPFVPRLKEIYERGLNIDLVAVDRQFAKYDLLSLTRDFRIVNTKEAPYIVDDRIGLRFAVDVPRELHTAIEDAISDGWVQEVAFHVTGITDLAIALEDLEFGALFSFDALRLPELSKLYDRAKYDDALWIKVGKNKPYSLTFEELCEDFPELDGNVVTRVVHLEFFCAEGRNLISHIDHEYILYSFDEYASRTLDSSVKGHGKLKTFKIDNARIPFDYQLNNKYFLFIVLDAYFKNKELIREYFAPIQSV